MRPGGGGRLRLVDLGRFFVAAVHEQRTGLGEIGGREGSERRAESSSNAACRPARWRKPPRSRTADTEAIVGADGTRMCACYCMRHDCFSLLRGENLTRSTSGNHGPAVGRRAGGYRGDDLLRMFIPQMAVAVQFRLDGGIRSRRAEERPDLRSQVFHVLDGPAIAGDRCEAARGVGAKANLDRRQLMEVGRPGVARRRPTRRSEPLPRPDRSAMPKRSAPSANRPAPAAATSGLPANIRAAAGGAASTSAVVRGKLHGFDLARRGARTA